MTKYNVEQTFTQKPLPAVVKLCIEIFRRYQQKADCCCHKIHCNVVQHVNVEQNKRSQCFLDKIGNCRLARAIIMSCQYMYNRKSLTMQIAYNIIVYVIELPCQCFLVYGITLNIIKFLYRSLYGKNDYKQLVGLSLQFSLEKISKPLL